MIGHNTLCILLSMFRLVSSSKDGNKARTANFTAADIRQQISNLSLEESYNLSLAEDGILRRITVFNPDGERYPVQLKLKLLDKWESSPSAIQVFAMIILINLLVGNVFTVLVFRTAHKSGSTKPLNLLILVDQGFKMFGNTWHICVVAASALFLWSDESIPLAKYTGATFCRVSLFVGILSVISNIAFGMGIALMRLLFIKYPLVIQGVEVRTSLQMIFGCLVITLFASYPIFVMPSRQQKTDDVCLGRSREFNPILYDYLASNKEPIVIHGLIITGFIFVIVEFFVYSYICMYLYNHDQSMRSILPGPTLKKRHNKNALDLFGHMLSFVIDNLTLIVAQVGIQFLVASDFTKVIIYAFALSSYGIYSFCQILLSRILKLELLNLLDTVLLIPLFYRVIGFFSHIGFIRTYHAQAIRNFRNSYLPD